jgi:hypothetical protein
VKTFRFTNDRLLLWHEFIDAVANAVGSGGRIEEQIIINASILTRPVFSQ